jgi:nitroreductase
MNQDAILSALKFRYATKKFDPTKKISSTDWSLLETSLILSPSSYGLEPWKFHVVENADLRERLKQASFNQTQVADASHYVVLTFKESISSSDISSFISRVSSIRGMPAESLEGYRKIIEGDLVHGPRSRVIETWSQRQSYIAFGFIMLTAAMLGIDTCPMEGIVPEQYDEILGLKGSGYKTVAGLALGYRHAEDKYAGAKKVRKSSNEVIVHHR